MLMTALGAACALVALLCLAWRESRCWRGAHDEDLIYATLTADEAARHGEVAGAPAWECPRCFARWPRADRGAWRPEEVHRAERQRERDAAIVAERERRACEMTRGKIRRIR